MSQKSPRTVPILLLLFVVVPFGLLLYKFLAGDAERGEVEPERPAVAQESVDDPVAPELESAAAATPGPVETAAVATPATGPSTRDAAESDPAFTPRTLAGRVQLSPNTPVDEEVVVIALADETDPRAFYRDADRVAHALYLAEMRTETPDENAGKSGRFVMLAAAPVDGAGRFTLELPPGTPSTHLLVSGRYHYSKATTPVSLPAESVEVMAQLGIWITGRVTAPAGAGPESMQEVELELGPDVFTSGFNAFEVGMHAQERQTETDADGRFEFRGLPTALAHGILAKTEGLSAKLETGIEGEAGEHVRRDLALTLGATLSGTVVDESGAPLAGADVAAYLQGMLGQAVDELSETETDEAGRFELANVMPGELEVRAELDGYREGNTRLSGEVTESESRDGITIELELGAEITGVVVFPDGSPAADVSVTAGPDPTGAQNLELMTLMRAPRGSTTTNESGEFSIGGLGKTAYAIEANLGGESREIEAQLLEIGEEHPAVEEEPWYARQGEVRAGDPPVTLVLEHLALVRGRVLDVNGLPVTAFDVEAVQEGVGGQFNIGAKRQRETFENREEGSFEFAGLANGSWSLTVTAEGFAPSEKTAVELPMAEDAPELVVTLMAGGVARGVVLGTDGQPVSGARVSRVLPMMERAQSQTTGRDESVYAGADGEFELDGLTAGHHEIVASFEGFADSEAVPLETQAGLATEELVLMLRVGGKLTGEVLGEGGTPHEGRMVIVQKTPDYSSQFMATTDAEGSFEFEHLTPGDWQVIAMANFMQGDAEPDEENPMAGMLDGMLMDVVEIVDGEELHIVLGAKPKDPVVVNGVVLHDGEPVGGSMVSFVPDDAKGISALKIKFADSEGRFQVTLDHPGAYLVTVQNNLGMGLQNNVEFLEQIPEGQEQVELEIELPVGRISGVVKGPDGEKLAEARVTLTVGDGIAYGSFLGGQYAEVMTDADGFYEMTYLRPGVYTVAAGGSTLGGIFGESAAGGRIVREGITVKEGQHVSGLDFRLEAPTRLTGTVLDSAGQPVSKASVFLRNEEGALIERFSLIDTDSGGQFTFTGLAPGRYSVLARKDGLSSAPSDPVESTADTSKGSQVQVQLESGSMVAVSVVDKSGAELRARISVVDPSGREYTGMLSMRDLMENFGEGFSSKEQRVGPLPPGRYKVTATADDGRTVSKPVTVSGQSERKVRLRFR